MTVGVVNIHISMHLKIVPPQHEVPSSKINCIADDRTVAAKGVLSTVSDPLHFAELAI